MSWDEAKLQGLVSDNVLAVNIADEEVFAARRNVRRKGQVRGMCCPGRASFGPCVASATPPVHQASADI